MRKAALSILTAIVAAQAAPPARAAPAAQQKCSAETRRHNLELGRAILEEVLGRGRIAENEHLYHPDFVAHSTRAGGGDATRAQDREATRGWRAAAPDLRVEVLRSSADCALAAVHFRAYGTNTGADMGLPGAGATFDVQGMTMFAVRDGKVAEEWTVFDQIGLLTQLKMLPQ